MLAVKSIALNAEGIAIKHEGPPLIVEGIEHHLDKIVVSQRIARQHVGADEARCFVFANESGEKVFARVAEVGDG